MAIPLTPSGTVLLPILLSLAVVPPSPGPVVADSVQLVREARDAQSRFERLRVRHAPQSWWSGTGPCDERVGRFCLRFGQEGDEREEVDRPSWTPPPEREAVTEAREELLVTLDRVGEAIPGDPWVAGQRISYLIEADRWERALEVARTCEASGWWCQGLEGVALHGLGRTLEAEERFRRVLEALDDDEREEWLDPSLVTEMELVGHLADLEGEELERERERIWALSNPLFLLEGNPVWTEHLARRVLALTREDARNGHAMRWGDDMTELLVRYGPVIAYERTREPMGYLGPPPVVGRYDPIPRHLIPSSEAVTNPSASKAADWSTHRRRTRSRHAPAEARRIHTMDSQVATFRRGDEVLIVVDWELAVVPDLPEVDSLEVGEFEAEAIEVDSIPAVDADTELETGLFLVDVEDLEPIRFMAPRTGAQRGVATAQVPVGDYLLSVEALDAEDRRAWRHRRGVKTTPMTRGVVQLSDLLLLEPLEAEAGIQEGEELEDLPLESLLLRGHTSLSLPPGPVEVVWEIYGLEGTEGRLDFELSATREDRSLLRRLGEALRIVSSRDPTRLRWEEGVRREDVADGTPYLRRVVMDLSALDPGHYDLSLAVTPPGRTPATTVRQIRLLDPSEYDARR